MDTDLLVCIYSILGVVKVGQYIIFHRNFFVTIEAAQL